MTTRITTTPVQINFRGCQIPADRYYEGNKVYYRLAWDKSIDTARIVLSFDRPRNGSNLPKNGTRLHISVEIGYGAMAQCIGQIDTRWSGKIKTFTWMADYARSRGLR